MLLYYFNIFILLTLPSQSHHNKAETPAGSLQRQASGTCFERSAAFTARENFSKGDGHQNNVCLDFVIQLVLANVLLCLALLIVPLQLLSRQKRIQGLATE
jgi:hypothetical protein